MSLEELFNKEKSKKDKEKEDWENKLKKQWNTYYDNAKEVMDKLSFLRQKGYVLSYDNFEPFNIKLANKDYYPRVRINDFINVTLHKNNDGTEELKVSSLGNFSLMGEKHSYESFIKKLTRGY